MEEKLKPLFKKEEEIKPLFKENFGVNLNLFRSWETDKIEIRKSELPELKPNQYAVTNHGDIYNVNTKNKLKVNLNRGYRQSTLMKDPNTRGDSKFRARPFRVCRIVAHAFIENNDKTKNVVNHIDGVRNNDYYKNLEWTDTSGNQIHALETGLNKNRGENAVFNTTFSEEQIRKICSLLEQGLSSREIMKEFGYNSKKDNTSLYRQIYKIKQKNCWKHVIKEYDF